MTLICSALVNVKTQPMPPHPPPCTTQRIFTAFWHPTQGIMTIVFRPWGSSDILNKEITTGWGRSDSDTKVQVGVGTLTREIFKCHNPVGQPMGDLGDSHLLVHKSFYPILYCNKTNTWWCPYIWDICVSIQANNHHHHNNDWVLSMCTSCQSYII